jgi:hypothetical protein
MTNDERDPEAARDAAEPEEGGFLDEAEEDIERLTEGDAEADEVSPPVDRAIAAAPASAAIGRRRDRSAAKAAPLAPSVSQQAVRVNDRASAIFVLAIVAMFAGIVVWALLFGYGGFVSDLLPTPTPAPTAVPTAVPSASPAASGSPAASPAASPSAAASPSVGASPSAAPSIAPSPSPSAS